MISVFVFFFILLPGIRFVNRKMAVNFLLLIGSVAVVIFLVEGACRIILTGKEMRLEKTNAIVGKDLYGFEYDRDLGRVLKKNDKRHASKFFSNGTVIYDVTYTTDELGRRTVGQEYLTANKHLILFGCSWAFGEGLNDQDTLQYMLGENLFRYNVYNYAGPGYGPQNMLALLETKRLPLEVRSNKGAAIYYFGIWDFDRAAGERRSGWVYDFPCYRLNKDGRLEREDFFRTKKPFITDIYKFLDELENTFSLFKLINFKLLPKPSRQEIRLTAEIIKEARKQYKNQFDGEFYVLINPLEHKNDLSVKELIGMLEESGVKVLYFPLEGNGYVISSDGHPTARLNQFLTNNLIRGLRN